MHVLDAISLAVGIAGVVVIRTIISYFLNKELAGSHDCSKESLEAIKEKRG